MISWRISLQNFWNNLLVMSSGPGAFSGLMSKRAHLISCSVGSPKSNLLSAWDTFSVIKRRDASNSVGEEVEKRSRKYWTATFSTSISLSTSRPCLSFILIILFLALLCFVMAWWNFVFLSPCLCHWSLLFCSQNMFSSRKAKINCFLKSSTSSVVEFSSSCAWSIFCFNSFIRDHCLLETWFSYPSFVKSEGLVFFVDYWIGCALGPAYGLSPKVVKILQLNG